MIGSIEKKNGTAVGFWQMEESEGTVADRDAFEAKELGWYLKTLSEEADASGRAQGNHS